MKQPDVMTLPSQHPILTVTLNPALDLATSAEDIRPGPKLRCAEPEIDPGGGGINVSRAIAILRGQSRVFVALGGATGQRLRDLLAAEGVETLPFDIPGETRQSLSVSDRTSGGQYRFVLPGPHWAAELAGDALAAITDALTPDTVAVLSGSLPPGVDAAFPALLAARMRAKGGRLLVDTSGPALDALITRPGGIDVLRMDYHEAQHLARDPLKSRAQTAAFAENLRARGAADIVVIARGADGSVLAGPDGRWIASRPAPQVVSAVGAGDSFVAAFTLATARALPPPEALRHGTAAASAAVMTPATRLCTWEETQKALEECVLERV